MCSKGKSIAEGAEGAEGSGEPSEPSVQSVPMPGEEEEDLIDSAWWRGGGADTSCSGGAAGRARPREGASAMARARVLDAVVVCGEPGLRGGLAKFQMERPNTPRFAREKFSEFPV